MNVLRKGLLIGLFSFPVFGALADRFAVHILYQRTNGAPWVETGISITYDRADFWSVPTWYWSNSDSNIVIWDDAGDTNNSSWFSNNTDSASPAYTGFLTRITWGPPTNFVIVTNQ